jgi:peroxiredoxin Q/BCP
MTPSALPKPFTNNALAPPALTSPPPQPIRKMISEGQLAPDFTLPTDEGKPLTLSSLRGRTVVLFFYPKDDTPG